jgi:hypothetical protein
MTCLRDIELLPLVPRLRRGASSLDCICAFNHETRRRNAATPAGSNRRRDGLSGGIASLNPRLMARTPIGVPRASKSEQKPDTGFLPRVRVLSIPGSAARSQAELGDDTGNLGSEIANRPLCANDS